MLGSVPSVITCTMPLVSSPFTLLSLLKNTTAMSAFWSLMSRSASFVVRTLYNMSKYSLAPSFSTIRCVSWSTEVRTTAVRTSLTSVEMAKPKRSIWTMGIPKRMSIVRLSRRMWRASLMTKDINCFIVLSIVLLNR